jgi:hypothetical protein
LRDEKVSAGRQKNLGRRRNCRAGLNISNIARIHVMLKAVGMPLFLCCFCVNSSHACTVPLGRLIQRSPTDYTSDAVAVFAGEVLEIEALEGSQLRAIVEVSRWWHGKTGRRTGHLDTKQKEE